MVGLFTPAASGMVEMAYEFDRPFVVSDVAARRMLGQTHTPFVDALATTVAWYGAPHTASAAVSARG